MELALMLESVCNSARITKPSHKLPR
jgi:hypothetical protein